MPDLDALASYAYTLPSGAIATRPTAARSAARLLVVGPPHEDRTILDLPALLDPDDLLVLNDARVVPARLLGRRATGGAVELLVVGIGDEGCWGDGDTVVALVRSNASLRVGEEVQIGVVAVEPVRREGRLWRLRVHGLEAHALLDAAGRLPIPPYILRRRRERGEEVDWAGDAERYQSVFGATPGAVAAPTAGLHFDDALLEAIRARGVRVAALSLLVGLGTFEPVATRLLSEHVMHRERYTIGPDLVAAVEACRAHRGRVVAVGTTVARALEAACDGAPLRPGSDATALMIRPGHRWRVVDALFTNFHLPESTLLALVCAFGGYEAVMGAYAHAIAAGYRFFSFGDAMFLGGRDRG